MGKYRVNSALMLHINATSTMLHDKAQAFTSLMEESLPDLKRQISESRTEGQPIYCNYLNDLHDSLDAIKTFNLMTELMTFNNPHYDRLAECFMDIIEMEKKNTIRRLGEDEKDGDVSIRHLVETHKDDLKQVIRECIAQAPVNKAPALRTRYNRLFPMQAQGFDGP